MLPGNAEASVEIEYAPMPVTLTAVPESSVAGDTVQIIAVFEADALDVELSDFTKDAGTLSDLQGADDTWGVTLTLPATGAGTVRVTLPAGSVSPYNAEAHVDVAYTRPAGELGVPQGLTVTFPTATSALLRWDPLPGDVDTYEISYENGCVDRYRKFTDAIPHQAVAAGHGLYVCSAGSELARCGCSE